MNLSTLTDKVAKSNLTTELIERSKRKEKLLIKGGCITSRSVLCNSLAVKTKLPLLLIVPTLEEATRWYSIMNNLSWDNVYIYPTSDISPYETVGEQTEIIRGQLNILSELNNIKKEETKFIIITTERALQPHLPPKEYIKGNSIYINKGDNLDLESLASSLSSLGYSKNNTTDQEGSWSRRGDIIDIYTVSNDLPIRIELYGDLVDKIKEYDPNSQRSLDELDKIVISPISIDYLTAKKLSKLDTTLLEEYLDEEIVDDIKASLVTKETHRLKGLAWEKLSNITDYVPDETILVISEKSQCVSHSNNWGIHVEQTYKDLRKDISEHKSNFKKPVTNNMYIDLNKIIFKLEHRNLIFISEFIEGEKSNNDFTISSKPIPSYPNQFGRLSDLIKSYLKDNYSIWIFSAQPSRVVALLEEHEAIAKFIPNPLDRVSIEELIDKKTPVALKCNSNSVLEGINLVPWKIILLTDKEFFGQEFLSYSGYIRRKGNASTKTVNPNKLEKGDYVVHRNHGIGKFRKIEKLIINNQSRDYLLVEYEDGTLRVAADQLNSLSRYRSSNESQPKINKMGGKSWISIKERARKAISKIAIDLVKLYAERENAKGYSFPKDGPWQDELEDSFQYEPTPDQVKAFKEVKEDMEKEKPMDRLVCGDVGYGKTEVAIRSLFKAITAGKQVALLSPTTILSQQHWRTLSDRFAPYPIKTALLNRFKTEKERKNIIKDLKEGKVDAIIGTHQLLSKHISFKNLGLLVIDEEQRFGVNHKEKIKQMKKSVDVLTLTATPIPRTLYMSLSGIREVSLITTPPPLRRAIKTHLIPKDNEVIKSAISQELDRGGQIFYVVPRIEGINGIAEKIKSIFPKIRLLIAHGQMIEGELESTMIAFNSGEADLMICTTIIESGLDIPRVNTILIEDSHKFGLSQLYQLRGRVGRSGVQAHAWLFYPKEEMITQKARDRLKAIQEFSELGSGYQLAMRDMEIRGVGNLIGTQQSGQIEAIGFDLYMEILQEAISEIRGQSIPLVEEVRIDLPITAFIPNQWIVDNEEKLAAYKEVTSCNSIVKLNELVLTWNDKYGVIPPSVETLIKLMKLKIITKSCGFYRIKKSGDNIVLETSMQESAFRRLRKALPDQLHSRFLYKKLNTNSEVIIRGLALLTIEKQIQMLMEWLTKMEAMVPNINEVKLTNITS